MNFNCLETNGLEQHFELTMKNVAGLNSFFPCSSFPFRTHANTCSSGGNPCSRGNGKPSNLMGRSTVGSTKMIVHAPVSQFSESLLSHALCRSYQLSFNSSCAGFHGSTEPKPWTLKDFNAPFLDSKPHSKLQNNTDDLLRTSWPPMRTHRDARWTSSECLNFTMTKAFAKQQSEHI